MRDWRRVLGALCIVLAMVLGAFAGFAYARDAGIVSASPEAGARGEDRRLVSAFDEQQVAYDPEEAQLLVDDASRTTAFAAGAANEVRSPDGVTALRVTNEERKAAVQNAVIETQDGTVTVRTQPVGTRYSGAGIDAGGPYGGPDVFEGTDLTFTVTPLDPTILFYRWDFDGDGLFDYPDQTGCGSIGCWTTEMEITRHFDDNFYATLVVEGWDGVSTYIVFNQGDNLGEPQSPYWYVYPANSGWKFTPKSDLRITELGMYQWFSMNGYGFSIRIWDVASQTTLGSCTPIAYTYQWSWCTLPTPVFVMTGQEYIIAEHKVYDYYPYFMGIYGPLDPQPDKITVGNFFYCWTWDCGTDAFPFADGGSNVIMMIDFRWEETLIVPDVASDTALLDVNNVAPTVFGVTTDPDPGLEGNPTEFNAWFSDPGLADDWWYQWTFHDGETGPWVPITKYSGGAKVLFLHTFAGDVTGLKNGVMAKCGLFCIKVDLLDFGPTGENRIPALSELTPYDVVVIGLNYFYYQGDALGDLLADYSDAGGNVVLMQAAFDSSYGTSIGIAGRWESDGYSPIDRGGITYWGSSLGAVYVPGHPLLDGVSTISATALRADTYGATAGATLVADWADGMALAATKENPIVSNGARSVALNFFPILGYTGGDYYQMIANAIRWASQQPDPVLKPMPIALDPYVKTYKDDEPTTTTPTDSFPMWVSVRDDDHGKMKVTGKSELYYNNFEDTSQCSGYYWMQSTWPPGWWADPDSYAWTCGYDYNYGGRAPGIWYYYNDFATSYLYSQTLDLSAYAGLQVEFYTWWWGDWPGGDSSGIVEVSADGGATFPFEIYAFHHNDPAEFRGTVTAETTGVGGSSSVVIRFRYDSADDWAWFVDNVRFFGVQGSMIEGLGTAEGIATIANVPPTAIGGFDWSLRNEAQPQEFKGFEISDPAIIEPTEWFAYAWDYGDGTGADWTYVGSLAPPKFDVLIVHTICLGTIYATCNAGGSGELTKLLNILNSLDDVGTVDTWNFINYPYTPTAPPIDLMMNYDVIIVATNWAYYSYAPFDLARRQVGDRLADYVDSGRGGVLTMMCVYCTSGGNDLFSIRGRYMDEDYGPHERKDYLFGAPTTIEILVPDHEFFVKVGPNVGSSYIYDALLPLTPGGRLLAKFDTGTTAASDKVHENGVRVAHFGGWHAPPGSDAPMLLRNMIGYVAGGIPSPKIPAFTHTFGDNGIYTVDFTAIDDDMGYAWDFATNEPMEVLPGASLSHRYVTVEVDNVEPTISPDSIQAFIAAQLCVRISGTAGNSVTVNLYTDGLLSASATVTRMGGSPNPTDEKCGLMKVDVLAPHTFEATLTYDAPMGGSNPTWLIIAPWRDPISPGHGTLTYKVDFNTPGTVTQDLPNLKRDLLAGGEGAKVDFVAEAYDPGTDDLAFLWSWGSDASDVYGWTPESVYAIHVHHNDGTARTDGVLARPQYLGFSEPYFDRWANDERSPIGTTDFRVRDTAVHAFTGGQAYYYVFLMVLDDDNGRGYPSPYGLDGIDVEVIVVDLT